MTTDRIEHWDPRWSETFWDPAYDVSLRETEFDVIAPRPRVAIDNLSIDEAMLYRVASRARRPLFWMWDWSEAAVIIGSYQSVSDEIDASVASARGFGFARRVSGGGAMVVEPGKTITWSLIVPESLVEGLSFVQSFAFLDSWCLRALRALDIPASYRPVNDIVSPGGKIAGAAQCRRKGAVLHHATMAWELDGALMRGLLRHGLPRANPKGIASAEKHVTPLSLFTPMTRTEMMEHLFASFGVLFKTRESDFTPDELADAAARAERLASEDWLYRVR